MLIIKMWKTEWKVFKKSVKGEGEVSWFGGYVAERKQMFIANCFSIMQFFPSFIHCSISQ